MGEDTLSTSDKLKTKGSCNIITNYKDVVYLYISTGLMTALVT